MEYVLRVLKRTSIFGWLHAVSLLFGFSYFGVHYINSSYLGQYLSQSDVGLLFAISSALSVLVLGSASVFLKKFGNYNVSLITVSGSAAALFGLACTDDAGFAFVYFVLFTLLSQATLFTFDIYLEANMRDENTTGSIRGVFLSMGLVAAMCAPAIASFLAGADARYEYAYFISALYALPILALLNYKFRTFVDPNYHVLSVSRTVRTLLNNRDLLHVSVAQFLLRFFFSWYVVYLPVYLHESVGFSWPEIGIILFLMLLPYALVEYPAGRIADKYIGEREMMAVGFLVAGISTGLLSWFTSSNIIVWGVILMVTRIGAALIESMTETYFFKKINGTDTSIISTFRVLHPLAYAVGPLIAGTLLLFVPLNVLWLILGCIMCAGVVCPIMITDTK